MVPNSELLKNNSVVVLLINRLWKIHSKGGSLGEPPVLPECQGKSTAFVIVIELSSKIEKFIQNHARRHMILFTVLEMVTI